jgi:hypothetical protein
MDMILEAKTRSGKTKIKIKITINDFSKWDADDLSIMLCSDEEDQDGWTSGTWEFLQDGQEGIYRREGIAIRKAGDIKKFFVLDPGVKAEIQAARYGMRIGNIKIYD